MLFDMHCHLDFDPNPAGLAAALAKRETWCYSVTVDPAGYERAAGLLGASDNVRVGVGLHPWWVPEDPVELAATLDRFESYAAATRYIGEVGLDFGLRATTSAEAQIEAFRYVAECCARQGGKLLSIHAVRSAGTVLDILEETGAIENNACIFHWFSGTSDELTRAVELKAWFSVGARMLASKRGRAYAMQVPLSALLLESDAPSEMGAIVDPDTWFTDLRATFLRLCEDRREDTVTAGQIIDASSAMLLRYW